MKQFNVDDERFPAKQTQWFIAGAKEDGLRPRDVEIRSDDDNHLLVLGGFGLIAAAAWIASVKVKFINPAITRSNPVTAR